MTDEETDKEFEYYKQHGLVDLLENHGFANGNKISLNKTQIKKLNRLQRRFEKAVDDLRLFILYTELRNVLKIGIFDELTFKFE